MLRLEDTGLWEQVALSYNNWYGAKINLDPRKRVMLVIVKPVLV